MKFLNKSTNFRKIKLILLLTLSYCSAATHNRFEKPVITFERNSTAEWTVIVQGEFSGPGFYSEKGEVFHASCSAPYPIKWDFTGLINPVSLLKIHEPERTFNPDKFTIKLSAFFNKAEDQPSLAASVRIQCEDLESFKKSEFSLYVKGNRNDTLVSPKNNGIVDPWFIPCPTTTPIEPINLFKLNLKEKVKVEDDIAYEPWRGFRKNDFGFFEEGVYLCRQGSSEVKFTAEVSASDDFYDPQNFENLTIIKPGMFLMCSSDNKEDVMEFKFEGDVDKMHQRWTDTQTWSKAVQIYHDDEKVITGKVSCLKNDVTLKEWNFEFMEAPEIFFDDYFGEMRCLTDFEERDGVEVEAKSVRCLNDIGCKYYERCLEEGNICDELGQVVYSDKRWTQCDPLEDEMVRDCVNLHYTSWNGIAQCRANGFKKNWRYFTALDLHKYTDWRKVNASNLLRLEKDEDNPNEFRCTGVGFLFAKSLGFELEFKNHSKELIQGEGIGGKVTIHKHPSPHKIQGFQVVSSLKLNNPEKVKSVRCVAPFWNSAVALMKSMRPNITFSEVTGYLFSSADTNIGDNTDITQCDVDNAERWPNNVAGFGIADIAAAFRSMMNQTQSF